MSERRAVIVASLAAASIIALQVAGKAARDSIFLGTLPVEALPGAMLAASVASLLTAWAISRWMTSRGPGPVATRLSAVAATGYVALAIAEPRAPRAVAYLLFVHAGIVGPIVVSAFWSVVNERFDPHRARRSVARIAGGATAGGVGGGLLAEGATRLFGARALLPMVAGTAVVVSLVVWRFARRARPRGHRRTVATSAIRALTESGYLRRILALVAVLAIASALLDVSLKTRVDLGLADEALPRFFARYYAALALVTFALQWLVAGPLLERAGLAVALSILPLTLLFGAGGAALMAGIAPIVATRGSTSSLESSLFRSAYELLYTPVAPGAKRAAKILLDVGGSRLGDALGSGLALVLATALPIRVADRVGLAVVVGLAAVALLLVGRLQGGYVRALAESVRSGAIRLRGPLDLTTRMTLSSLGLDRERVLADAASPEGDVRMALASRDPEAVRAALEGPLDGAGIDAALGLLTTEHARLVERRLRAALPQHRAILEAALADPSRRVAVRARLPKLLASCADEAAVITLVEGLREPAFPVRRESALALQRLARREGGPAASSDALMGAAMQELGRSADAWRAQDRREAPGATLRHTLVLLGLALGDPTLRTCHTALMRGDPSLRGTALEYLAQVVPEPAREALFVVLDAQPAREPSRRDRSAIADELFRSLRSLEPSEPSDDGP